MSRMSSILLPIALAQEILESVVPIYNQSAYEVFVMWLSISCLRLCSQVLPKNETEVTLFPNLSSSTQSMLSTVDCLGWWMEELWPGKVVGQSCCNGYNSCRWSVNNLGGSIFYHEISYKGKGWVSRQSERSSPKKVVAMTGCPRFMSDLKI